LFPWHLPTGEALDLAHKLIGYAAMTIPAIIKPGGNALVCEILLVAGGGGAGGRNNSGGTGDGPGGGSGGGIVWYAAYPLRKGSWPAAVGIGGGGSNVGVAASNGGNTTFGDQYGPLPRGYLAVGGGRGGNYDVSLGYSKATSGGSGGGNSGVYTDNVTPLAGYPAGDRAAQGNNGGAGSGGAAYIGSGGGGALAAGQNATQAAYGLGGAGQSYSTSGSAYTYSKGGDGMTIGGTQGPNAANYGWGGNGSVTGFAGGNGYQGLIYIQYAGTVAKATVSGSAGSGTVGGKTQHYFTGAGTFTVTTTP